MATEQGRSTSYVIEPGGLEQYVQELDRLMASGAGEEAIRRAGEPWDTELVGPPLSPERAH